jgi:signal peptidase I
MNINKLYQTNRSFLLFILLMLCFRSAIADMYHIPSGSMEPTIMIGDRIAVNKLAYDLRLPFTQTSLVRLDTPQRGDIIVFNSTAADNRLIKRVVALPGDQVAMDKGILTINGQQVKQTPLATTVNERLVKEHLTNSGHLLKIKHQSATVSESFREFTVSDGHYLVLGDNRKNSADSRVFGLVPHHEILGKAQRILFSIDWHSRQLFRPERTGQKLI